VLALAAALLTMTGTTAPSTLYAALGDSTGVGVGARRGGGYPARLVQRARHDGRTVELLNLCVSGAGVGDVVADQLKRAVAARPAVVTVGVGINDVMRGTDLKSFRAGYERVADALAATGARVVLLNVPDLSLSPLAQGDEARRTVRSRVEAVNEVITTAARLHGFRVVDLFGATEREMSQPDLLSEDRFHPSDAGYERWTDLAQPEFEAAMRASAGSRPASLSTERPLR
jgi:lysophospholipase L1-like esterase